MIIDTNSNFDSTAVSLAGNLSGGVLVVEGVGYLDLTDIAPDRDVGAGEALRVVFQAPLDITVTGLSAVTLILRASTTSAFSGTVNLATFTMLPTSTGKIAAGTTYEVTLPATQNGATGYPYLRWAYQVSGTTTNTVAGSITSNLVIAGTHSKRHYAEGAP